MVKNKDENSPFLLSIQVLTQKLTIFHQIFQGLGKEETQLLFYNNLPYEFSLAKIS